ncbi:hypothetical protein CONLIGDRAFT_41218 [Coniochaeta ligniaria NRRL 30616]|uniref:Uncharacterized protein n=1 Tax=Coniochaeta ligniaria NRRL 30616 TaxID=1408157 RepID=A0A1J7K053_9PEZI|nr:hypothetical protein CONLIGDRAFT_41218 [Coniochaeta ligniaria NRRL 30616]
MGAWHLDLGFIGPLLLFRLHTEFSEQEEELLYRGRGIIIKERYRPACWRHSLRKEKGKKGVNRTECREQRRGHREPGQTVRQHLSACLCVGGGLAHSGQGQGNERSSGGFLLTRKGKRKHEMLISH